MKNNFFNKKCIMLILVLLGTLCLFKVSAAAGNNSLLKDPETDMVSANSVSDN